MSILLTKFKALTHRGGNVAMIFALCLVPIIAIAALTLDFQRTTLAKNQVQAELDASVLRGARHIMNGKTPSEVEGYIIAELASRVSEVGGLSCDPVTVQFANRNREITGSMICSEATTFGRVIGRNEVKFDLGATSSWDVGLLDVAFMFDISGSMNSSNRLNSLKGAATDALDILLPKGNESLNEGVRIAMVAYDDMVNAGDLFEEVTGLAKKRTYYATDRFRNERTIRKERYKKEVCRNVGRTCQRRNSDGRCTKWGGGTRKCTDEWRTRRIKEYYGPTKTRTVRKTIDSSCVWERNGIEAFSDVAPTYSAAKQPRITSPVSKIYNATEKMYNASEITGNPHAFVSAPYAYLPNDHPERKDKMKSPRFGCSNIQVLPLNRDRGKLEQFIKALKTRGGGTAGHQGIAWSWYLISENWRPILTGDMEPFPFDQPSGRKAVILMSDGDFIDEEFKSELGTSDQQARKLCDGIKAQGEVEIYTVAFQAPPAGEAVLEYCASTPSMAFSADDATELREAYNAIAGSLSELRIKR